MARKSRIDLSVVFSGRNDDYGGDFAERVLAAFDRNQKEARIAGVFVEWLFIEWNPLNTDYLSYQLAPLGCKCIVVDPGWHEKLIVPGQTFARTFAKNVGIRRASGNWILSTNPDVVFDDQVWSSIAGGLDPGFLHRTVRSDVDWHFFDEPFQILRDTAIRRHTPRHGSFCEAAGDFLLFPIQRRFGFDEAINYTEIHCDGRFCENWSAIMSNGQLGNTKVFRFIGDIFKADHPLTYFHLAGTQPRLEKWDYRERTCDGPALYENKLDWGLRDAKQHDVAERIWYLDY